MFIKRTAEQILNSAMKRLSENTAITNTQPGSIARTLYEGLDQEIEHLYDYADQIQNMSKLETASGIYLDQIGALFSYPRRMELTIHPITKKKEMKLIADDTYRFEISKRVQVSANANEESLLQAARQVPGVRDVKLIEYVYGPASCALLVSPQNGLNTAELKANIELAISQVKAAGIRLEVWMPRSVQVELTLKLELKNEMTVNEKEQIKEKVKQAVIAYFASFMPGDDFIYYELVQRIMDVSDSIIDFDMVSFLFRNERALLINQFVEADELIELAYILIT